MIFRLIFAHALKFRNGITPISYFFFQRAELLQQFLRELLKDLKDSSSSSNNDGAANWSQNKRGEYGGGDGEGGGRGEEGGRGGKSGEYGQKDSFLSEEDGNDVELGNRKIDLLAQLREKVSKR